MNTLISHNNLIWLKIKPTTTITTSQQLVIEVPTVSVSGILLFQNDLGTGLTDGSILIYDILGGSFTTGFMVCRLFHGDRTKHKPGRIACGNFLSDWTSTQTLFFAIKLGNPS